MARQNTEKRLQILRVSYELFSGVEYEAVSLADIAKRAEISKSLLQYYYPQKIEIVQDLLSDILNISFSYTDNLSAPDEDVMQEISDFNMLFFKAVEYNYHLNQFIMSSVSRPQLLDLWIETICSWLRKVCGENTFSYLQLKTALCFAMGGSMHLFQHKDELGIDYHFYTENHIRTILGFLKYDQKTIDEICGKTRDRVEQVDINAFLKYCEDSIQWFSL